MQKIKKKEHDEILALHLTVEAERSKYNDLVADLNARIKIVVDEFHENHEGALLAMESNYQAAYNKLCSCIEVQTTSMSNYELERSDSWHDGAGVEYTEWRTDWECVGGDMEDYLDIGRFEGVEVLDSSVSELPKQSKG